MLNSKKNNNPKNMNIKSTVLMTSLMMTTSFIYAGTSDKTKDIDSFHQVEKLTFAGGVFGGGSFLLLQPSASDADLEFGTIVGPTLFPPTLTAHLQKITPNYQGAMQFDLGYQLPVSSYDITANYFHFSNGFNGNARSPALNFIIQNYLGNSFVRANADVKENVHRLHVNVGQHQLIGGNLYVHPYLGIDYVYLKRFFKTSYVQSFFAPFQTGLLVGNNDSHFKGIGPILGANFSYPLMNALRLVGNINGSLLASDLNYKLNSFFQLGNVLTTYNASTHDNLRMSAAVSSDLALQYILPLNSSEYITQIQAGYHISDFIQTTGRIYPYNGYANNPAGPNPPSMDTKSSLGFNGPFVKMSLVSKDTTTISTVSSQLTYPNGTLKPGWFVDLTNLALKSEGQDSDLDYAIVNTPSGQYAVRARSSFHWAGEVGGGYIFPNSNVDVQLHYLYVKTDGSDNINTGSPAISSLNSNGPTNSNFPPNQPPQPILFAKASSKVQYRINHVNLTSGKYFLFDSKTLVRLFTGLTFAQIKRKQIVIPVVCLQPLLLLNIPCLRVDFKA
jgi:Legionella pneumophila major outer membrane protein precursor